MVMIPKRKSTKHSIDKKEYGGNPRTYLGMSGIGEDCYRKLWYGFHWVSAGSKFAARTQRIFDVGHLYEQVIIGSLKSIGIEVFRVDENEKEIEMFGTPNEEQEELVGFAGHALGHNDGRVRGVIETPKMVHLAEFKSMQQKYFLPLVKKGIKATNPKYYAQAQRYMESLKLTRTLFVVMNKNDQSLYVERIEYDKGFAKDLVKKEMDIIMAYEPPPKHYIPGFFKCNFCQSKEVCHEDGRPEKNCRTCDFSDLENEGKWSCSNRKFIDEKHPQCEDDYILPVKRQRKGCKHHQFGWKL